MVKLLKRLFGIKDKPPLWSFSEDDMYTINIGEFSKPIVFYTPDTSEIDNVFPGIRYIEEEIVHTWGTKATVSLAVCVCYGLIKQDKM